MIKAKVYLDTTILSYLFDKRDSLKTYIDVTKNWWDTQRKYYSIYLSEETLIELKQGNYPFKEDALEEALKIDVLPHVQEINDVAEAYIKHLLMPQKLEGDVFHLSYASIYKMDFLLTWNCNHLANANKKQHIRIINTKLGLPVPEIITPLELFQEEEL